MNPKEFLIDKEILRSDLVEALAPLLREFSNLENQENFDRQKLWYEMLLENTHAIYLHLPKGKRQDMLKYMKKRGFKIIDCQHCKNAGCNKCHYTGLQLKHNAN